MLPLIPALPFASSAILLLFGRRMPRRAVAALGVGSVALAAVIAIALALSFREPYEQVLWTWMRAGQFRAEIGFRLDALALLMTFVVTFVGALIHLYSVEYMAGDEGYSRFFGYMNLFAGAMLVLVLANNLLLLYLGWEGVGLCSYLLIGFWYTDPANGAAARKAFIVTRVGDTAMAFGLFLLFHSLGTLHIQDLLGAAEKQWAPGSGLAVAGAALLLGGALGKSAQLPLQVWLPDAMAGPTPTSALIHAATMVTAGVYLIARTDRLFALAPPVQAAVAAIGAATLLAAGFSALTQHDIKRVLAYSTVSQIGYMFLALGVGAWQAAMFHFMTHAFFKALLFMAAGVVILALHHEQNMFRMGGLRTQLPFVFWTFLIGGAALAGFPLITAGFWSKDLILWRASGHPALWAAGIAGVFLTALYTTRQILLVFFGEPRAHAHGKPGPAVAVPLAVLAALSIVGGFFDVPGRVFGMRGEAHAAGAMTEAASGLAATAALALGALLGLYFYRWRRTAAEAVAANPAGSVLRRWWFSDWGMDWLYERLFVRPYIAIARVNRRDFIDGIYDGIAALSRALHEILSFTETGRVRWYAATIALGSVLFVAVVLLS